jgi:hypothetical protein
MSKMGLLAAAVAVTATNKNNTPTSTTLANKNKSAGRLNEAKASIWRMVEAAYSGIHSIDISAGKGHAWVKYDSSRLIANDHVVL